MHLDTRQCCDHYTAVFIQMFALWRQCSAEKNKLIIEFANMWIAYAVKWKLFLRIQLFLNNTRWIFNKLYCCWAWHLWRNYHVSTRVQHTVQQTSHITTVATRISKKGCPTEDIMEVLLTAHMWLCRNRQVSV